MTIEEEYEHIRLAKQGVQSSIDVLVKVHHSMIHAYTNRLKYRGNYTADDAYNDGVIGIMEAIRCFDMSTGNRFSTLASQWIKAQVYRQMTYQDKTVNLPANFPTLFKAGEVDAVDDISMDEVKDEEGNPFSDFLADEAEIEISEDKIRYESMHKAIAMLSERHKAMIAYRLKGLSQSEIGAKLGVTEKVVRRAMFEHILPSLRYNITRLDK